MKRTLAVLFTILIVVSFSFGQEQRENRLGFGVSLNPAGFNRSLTTYTYFDGGMYYETYMSMQSPVSFYIPIYANKRFRLEPAFGFSSLSNETVTSTTSPGSISVTRLTKASSAFVGLSGYFIVPVAPQLEMYVGPRLGISFVSAEYQNSNYYSGSNPVKYTSETNEIDFTVGAACGAEFFPVGQLSVGGEFQFNYTSYGNPDVTRSYSPPQPSASTTTSERKQHLLSTDVLFFLRWYFVQN